MPEPHFNPNLNARFQAVAKAVSDLLNDEVATAQDKVSILAAAYRWSPVADGCERCMASDDEEVFWGSMTWPVHFEEDTGRGYYLCDHCHRRWHCSYTTALLNPWPEGWAMDSKPGERDAESARIAGWF